MEQPPPLHPTPADASPLPELTTPVALPCPLDLPSGCVRSAGPPPQPPDQAAGRLGYHNSPGSSRLQLGGASYAKEHCTQYNGRVEHAAAEAEIEAAIEAEVEAEVEVESGSEDEVEVIGSELGGVDSLGGGEGPDEVEVVVLAGVEVDDDEEEEDEDVAEEEEGGGGESSLRAGIAPRHAFDTDLGADLGAPPTRAGVEEPSVQEPSLESASPPPTALAKSKLDDARLPPRKRSRPTA